MKQYTIAQASKLLGVSRQYAWQLVAMKRLRAYRIGKLWVINASDLEKFKERREI